MSPLRIEAKEPFNVTQTEILTPIDAEKPLVKKVDQEGKETQIEPGKVYSLLPGEVIVFPDALRTAGIYTDLGLRVSKQPSRWSHLMNDPKEDEVQIWGCGLSGAPEHHSGLQKDKSSIKSLQKIQANELGSPVTAWVHNKPIAVISWEKEK